MNRFLCEILTAISLSNTIFEMKMKYTVVTRIQPCNFLEGSLSCVYSIGIVGKNNANVSKQKYLLTIYEMGQF